MIMTVDVEVIEKTPKREAKNFFKKKKKKFSPSILPGSGKLRRIERMESDTAAVAQS